MQFIDASNGLNNVEIIFLFQPPLPTFSETIKANGGANPPEVCSSFKSMCVEQYKSCDI
jgi:hypothetical protein